MLQFVKWEEGSREQKTGCNGEDGRVIMASGAGNSKRQKWYPKVTSKSDGQKWGQNWCTKDKSKNDFEKKQPKVTPQSGV